VEGATIVTTEPTGSRIGRESREATSLTTRILRVTLAMDDARAYWERVDPRIPPAERPLRAFEERWFGSRSLERIRFLLSTFAERFDAFGTKESALDILRRWTAMDVTTRQVLCHWHVQLSDPLYRDFTGRFLVSHRGSHDAKVDRDIVLRWIRTTFPDRWSDATVVQFASKLLSAASGAGLVSSKRDPRSLHFPKVPDLALAYMLHLLRETKFEGSLTANPYFASVGLEADILDQRLRALGSTRAPDRALGVTYRRMGALTEFDWTFPSLAAWAEASL
jgi:hypothetical protein